MKVDCLAEGAGWRVDDVVCTAGPQDRPFEERHDGACVAAVMEGSFQYRTTTGSALLAPGALMLGNAGQCFRCSHDHATGDHCLAFGFDPAFLEDIAAAVPGASKANFSIPRLAPTAQMTSLFAAAEVACRDADPDALGEIAVRMAGAAVTLSNDSKLAASLRSRDARRITMAVRRIEAEANTRLRLHALARDAAMSPYHFLRTFRALVGMTPHQFLLQTRLRSAAVRLRQTHDSIAAIAFDCGFGDLSTFNRQFRRIVGRTPGDFRRGGALSDRLPRHEFRALAGV